MGRWALWFGLLAGIAFAYGSSEASGVAAGIARAMALLLGTLAGFIGVLHLTRRRRGHSKPIL